MPRTGNIVGEIKRKADLSKYDMTTAEGRADFDDWIRAEIKAASGDDENLRRHAGAMIVPWRRDIFDQAGRVEK
jgi:hypothetical protein